jgi:transcriptional regulator with GAF, ATPase, and Fis domain
VSSLLTIKGYNTGVRYRLESESTTIGRAPENTIQLLDNNVSRLHAEIRRDRMAYTILDKDSRNGLFVNGKRMPDKILRRNDEIIVGATHFLFDSDFEVRNTLFTNKSVYMCAPADETVIQAIDDERLELLDEYQTGGLQLIEKISNVISSEDVQLPTASQEILASVVDVVGARRGVIMRWDPIERELVPLSAICEEDQMTLNRAIIQKVFQERRAVLTSDVEIDLRYAEHPNGMKMAVSVACAPIGTESRCEGVIYVDSNEPERFSLRDVSMLAGVGRLFYMVLQMTKMHDRCEAMGPAPTEMIGASRVIRTVREQAARIAKHDTPVLVTGETGTGKELLAREIHANSSRRDGPFVAINCSAIPETLIESELFGYEKGAFTGADRLTRGKIEVAAGGTLFLDEVGELSLSAQPKLLRFLQNQVFYRVGGTRLIQSNVRIIAATNADLRKLVEKTTFRSDLMFRLNVVELNLPPLRERREDIALLIDFFMRQFSRELKKNIQEISAEAKAYLSKYPWPGNIRELANCVERAILLSDRPVLDVADFALSVHPELACRGPRFVSAETDTQSAEFFHPSATLAEMERAHILSALDRNNWNQVRTAEELGIHRNTLRNKIQEYSLAKVRA